MEWAFLILLTFASDGQHTFKQFMCIDAHCVGKMERRARESTTLQRFRVFERGRDGINATSAVAYWQPVIDWSPL